MSKLLKLYRKMVTPLIFVMGVIIFALSIAGMTQAFVFDQSYSFFAVILAMIILMWMIGALNTYLEKTSAYDNYDVEQQSGSPKKGSENAGFEKETGGDEQVGPMEKWVKNYVPYDDFPKGKEGSREENGIEKKDAEKSLESGEKWKKNYVPYKEEEDSNKDKE